DLDTIPDFEDRHTLAAESVFDPAAAVDAGDTAETINVGKLAGLTTGDAVKYSAGGGDPLGNLGEGWLYCTHVDDSDLNNIKIRLFDTRPAAFANEKPIDLNLDDTSGTEHRIYKVVDAYRPIEATIDPVLDVDGAANLVNKDVSSLGLKTGDT